MIILSIDQAKLSGISIWEQNIENDDAILIHHELFKAKGNNYEEIIFNICDHVEELINQYGIGMMLLENVQNQMSSKTFRDLSKLLGGLLEVCNKHQLEYLIFSPATWRTILHAKKSMKREELKELSKQNVLNKLGLSVDDNVGDSINMALYYFEKYLGGE